MSIKKELMKFDWAVYYEPAEHSPWSDWSETTNKKIGLKVTIKTIDKKIAGILLEKFNIFITATESKCRNPIYTDIDEAKIDTEHINILVKANEAKAAIRLAKTIEDTTDKIEIFAKALTTLKNLGMNISNPVEYVKKYPEDWYIPEYQFEVICFTDSPFYCYLKDNQLLSNKFY